MKNNLEGLARLIRYFILVSTTNAGSGHPTSSLSAVELMTSLFFARFARRDGFFRPSYDRLIFSKGHASPLFYSLWAAAGAISEKEILTLRRFGSRLEGHPSMAFPFTEVPTGSLGQGLSTGVGMALNAKYLDKLDYNTFVLLGDSEMAEGSVWEAIQIASFYKLNNLIGILDVNRLGQSRETMYGYDVGAFEKRISSFGWNTTLVDGHNFSQIGQAYQAALGNKNQLADGPTMIIAKTIKGKGVKFWEDKAGWHGRPLPREELEKALNELGPFDKKIRGKIMPAPKINPLGSDTNQPPRLIGASYSPGEMVATRKAYGNALVRIYPKYPNMVVLDGEVSNSTYSEIFAKAYPGRYFEMFIAEQNMVGVALGLSARGKMPFVSSFACFLERAFDQIRMAQYANCNIKFCGSHAGVSIGEDGPSQMGLEDIAMFRTILGSVVLYPCDGVSADRLTEEAAKHKGIVYIRTTRKETPVIYSEKDRFPIGGSKTLRSSSKDQVTVIGAGITLHEALEAYELLKKSNIFIRVIDLYSIKPLDLPTLQKTARETKAIIVVEDHHPEGGIFEAVTSALSNENVKIYSLAVRKIPGSGKPDELLDFEEISASAIIKKVRQILK
ncbi:MAG: transketolase [Patescibacteria group bacterium]